MLTGQILLQLVVILLVVQLFGFLCRRIGQQWVIGEILAGLALGPSLLGLLSPGLKAQIFPLSALPTLQTLGDIGLILYMFSLGARLDTNQMVRQSGKAVIASLSGISLPLLLGAGLAYLLYPSLHAHDGNGHGHYRFPRARPVADGKTNVGNQDWHAGPDVCLGR